MVKWENVHFGWSKIFLRIFVTGSILYEKFWWSVYIWLQIIIKLQNLTISKSYIDNLSQWFQWWWGKRKLKNYFENHCFTHVFWNCIDLPLIQIIVIFKRWTFWKDINDLNWITYVDRQKICVPLWNKMKRKCLWSEKRHWMNCLRF